MSTEVCFLVIDDLHWLLEVVHSVLVVGVWVCPHMVWRLLIRLSSEAFMHHDLYILVKSMM